MPGCNRAAIFHFLRRKPCPEAAVEGHDPADRAAPELPLGSGTASGESAGITYFNPLANPGFVFDIASDAAGNAWFTASNVIGRLTPAGVVTLFEVPTVDGGSAGGAYITAGPDGNMWFTSGSGSLGRITPSGSFSFFLPDGALSFFELVTGGDGNLWFDEPPSGRVAKMTAPGKVTEFDVGARQPRALIPLKDAMAVGPNGDVWFADALDGRDVPRLAKRSAADGSAQSFREARYASIAVDSTNNAWFVGTAVDLPETLTVGRVDDVTGGVALYAANCPGSMPSSAVDHHGVIATGAGNAVWFTESRGATLGRIDTATLQATCFHAFGNDPTFGSGAYPERIAPAPNGSVWFIETAFISPFGGFPGDAACPVAIGIGHLVP